WGIGMEGPAAVTPRRRCHAELSVGFPQNLAWQGQVDRPAWFSHGHFQGPIHYRLKLGKIAQLVVPLDVLTQHAGLVKGLLGPVDVDITRPWEPGLRERGTTSREQDGYVITSGIDDAIQGVRGANGDVHHDHLWLASDHVVPVRHRHRGIFVRYSNRFRRLFALLRKARKGINDWRKVRPGVGEEIVNAAFTE